MIWTTVVIAAAIYSLFAIFVLSLCKAAARYDGASFDDLDVYCPHCDGTDIYDWGEGDWYACHSCRLMFQWPEPAV